MNSTRALLATVAAAAAFSLAGCGTQVAPGAGGSGTGGGGDGAGTGPAASGTARPVTDQSVEADGALACPQQVTDPQGQAVPAKPEGVDGAARLLPDREPTSMVVCTYPVLVMVPTNGGGPSGPPYTLTKRTVLTQAGRTTLAEQLTWAPRAVPGASKACTAMGGSITNYLVGAMYGDAIVWVAAQHEPNNCPTASNGDFVSRESFGQLVAGASGAIAMLPMPPAGSCGTPTWGRLGDDESLAPEGTPSVTVCRPTNQGTDREFLMNEADSRRVVAALRSARTAQWDSSCDAGAQPDYSHDVRLLLTYPKGPAVLVNVLASCGIVAGGGLQAPVPDGLLGLVESLSPVDPSYNPNGSVSSDGTVVPGQGVTTVTGTPGGAGGGMEPALPTSVPAPVFPPDATVLSTPPPR